MKPKQSEDEKLFRIGSYSRSSITTEWWFATRHPPDDVQSEQSFIWPSLHLNVAGRPSTTVIKRYLSALVLFACTLTAAHTTSPAHSIGIPSGRLFDVKSAKLLT